MACFCTFGPNDPRCCMRRGSSVNPDMNVESVNVQQFVPAVQPDLDALLTKEFNNLRGRICGLIESWGLPETQERGCKSTFKSLTYDAQQRVSDLIGD